MRQIFFCAALCCIAMATIAQNVGIGNIDPKSALDINGGLRIRPVTTIVSGSSVVLNPNTGNHFLNGSPASNFTISFSPAAEEGKHTIITNTTLFTGNLFGTLIPPATTVELFYSNGGWKQIGSSAPINASAWSLSGNTGTDAALNFIGTLDNQPLAFRINNQSAGSIDRNNNTALGYLAMSNITDDAQSNSAWGASALKSLKIGVGNVAIGRGSANSQKSGNHNIAIGLDALATDTIGSETVAIGYNALAYNQNRAGNTAVGTNSLFYNSYSNTTPITTTQGLHNTALGHSALFSNRRGSGAVAIGYNAAYSDTAAEGVIAIGRAALYNNKSRLGNVAIGDSALYYNGFGIATAGLAEGNTAVGSKALYKNTAGIQNTALGFWALRNNVSGDLNTAIGHVSSVANISGIYNTSVGVSSLQSNRYSNFNVAIGNDALQGYNSSGEESGNNVAIGAYALYQHNNGVENVAVGRGALSFNYIGGRNTAVGFEAGGRNYYGSGNVFLGYKSGSNSRSNNKLYIDNSNDDSLNALIYGDFAADSLLLNAKTINKFSLNVRGSFPLEMGYGAADKQTDAGKICYGCFGDPAHWLGIVGGGTNALGTDRVIKLWSEGGLRVRGNALPDANNLYTLGNSGQRWKEVWTNAGAINTSDANLKTNITSSPYGLDAVMQMNPVQYNWKTTPTEDLQIGFLAQDIQKIIPEAVVVPSNGDPLGMKYNELIPVLVKGMQEQQQIIEKQQKQIDELYKLLKAKQ